MESEFERAVEPLEFMNVVAFTHRSTGPGVDEIETKRQTVSLPRRIAVEFCRILFLDDEGGSSVSQDTLDALTAEERRFVGC